MLAHTSSELATMLADPTFIDPIELRGSFTYELDALDARGGKPVIGGHPYRTSLILHGALNLYGRFRFSDLLVRVAPETRGINCAWGAHSEFINCIFASLDPNKPALAGLWSDRTADNNNSFGIHIDKCSFTNFQVGLQIMRGANDVVGGWTIRDTDFSHSILFGLSARSAAGLYLDNCLFQDNGIDAFLQGSEIQLSHCHAERQTNADRISVVIHPDTDPVLFVGGNIAYHRERIRDNSGKVIILGAQETHAMLTEAK